MRMPKIEISMREYATYVKLARQSPEEVESRLAKELEVSAPESDVISETIRKALPDDYSSLCTVEVLENLGFINNMVRDKMISLVNDIIKQNEDIQIKLFMDDRSEEQPGDKIDLFALCDAMKTCSGFKYESDQPLPPGTSQVMHVLAKELGIDIISLLVPDVHQMYYAAAVVLKRADITVGRALQILRPEGREDILTVYMKTGAPTRRPEMTKKMVTQASKLLRERLESTVYNAVVRPQILAK